MNDARVEAIARRHGIRLLLQFGSSVSGRTHPKSDVDLGVLLETAPIDFETYGTLTSDLQRLFPEREVDVALINRADPLFLKKITDQCQLLYGEPRQLYELKIYAFKRYQDHRRFLTMEREYVERRIAALTAR